MLKRRHPSRRNARNGTLQSKSTHGPMGKEWDNSKQRDCIPKPASFSRGSVSLHVSMAASLGEGGEWGPLSDLPDLPQVPREAVHTLLARHPRGPAYSVVCLVSSYIRKGSHKMCVLSLDLGAINLEQVQNAQVEVS